MLPPGGLDLLEVQGQVALQVAQHRRDLGHRHPQHAGCSPIVVGRPRCFGSSIGVDRGSSSSLL